jgi:endonuclease/exonuclease/phosphatase family metal-dependent hydrolase
VNLFGFNKAYAHLIRVLTLNLAEEGPARGIQGAKKWARLIRQSKADLVGLQEIYDYVKTAGLDHGDEIGDHSFIRALVAELGWNILNENTSSNTCVITRFPTKSKYVVLANEKKIIPVSIHLTDYPYQVCQLYKCVYGDAPFLATAAEAVAGAQATRTKDLAQILKHYTTEELKSVLMMGDMNEPSKRDWTHRAVAHGLYRMSVPWPTTAFLEKFGFHDVYRVKHTDELKHPGHTYPAPQWHDKFGIPVRIDYIFAQQEHAVIDSGIFFVPDGWPSDHMAVWADIEV